MVPFVVAVVGLVAASAFAAVQWWPSDDDGDDASAPTTVEREPQVSPQATTTTTKPEDKPVADDLLGGDFPAAYQDLLAAAGGPAQLLDVEIHDTYAFVAYRDLADPSVINQRQWRNGEVGDAEVNLIDDRVDARTEPDLWTPPELDATLVAQLVADAPLHYDVPTEVTHVIVDRFLPFDERVLIRVYAVPTDGRSGGGYVSYDTAGALVTVCC